MDYRTLGARTAALAVEGLMAKKTVVVERYENEKAYQRDANRKAKQGYVVDSVIGEEQKKGCLSWGLLGVFNIFRKNKTELVVTYRLEQ